MNVVGLLRLLGGAVVINVVTAATMTAGTWLVMQTWGVLGLPALAWQNAAALFFVVALLAFFGYHIARQDRRRAEVNG